MAVNLGSQPEGDHVECEESPEYKQGAAYVMIGVKRYLSDNSKYDSVDFSILDGEDKVGKGGG